MLIFLSSLLIFAVLFLIFEIYVVIIGHLKGAPFVRSSRKKIDAMLAAANIQSGELVVDLGSGDGTLLIEAGRRGAKAIGLEINPFLVGYSRIRTRLAGLEGRVKIFRKDFRDYQLQDADVIFVYLWPETLVLLKNKFTAELKPGARIISNAFRIPELHETKNHNGIFCYII